MHKMTILLSEHEKAMLDAIVKAKHTTISSFIRDAIRMQVAESDMKTISNRLSEIERAISELAVATRAATRVPTFVGFRARAYAQNDKQRPDETETQFGASPSRPPPPSLRSGGDPGARPARFARAPSGCGPGCPALRLGVAGASPPAGGRSLGLAGAALLRSLALAAQVPRTPRRLPPAPRPRGGPRRASLRFACSARLPPPPRARGGRGWTPRPPASPAPRPRSLARGASPPPAAAPPGGGFAPATPACARCRYVA